MSYEDNHDSNGLHHSSPPHEHLDNQPDFNSQHDSDLHEKDSSRSNERYRDTERKRDRHDERDRDRDRDRDRGKSRDRHRHRDRERGSDRDRNRDRERDDQRDRRRERSEIREKSRDIDDDHRHNSRHYDRRREYDDEREDRYRRSSRSQSRSRSHHRSRSRSRSRSKSKRISGFDMPLPTAVLPGAIVPGITGQISGSTGPVPGLFPNMFPLASTQLGTLPVMPVQAMTQQATRHARRVYVGGLPPSANEQSVAIYFSHVMAAIGGNTAGPGDAVVNVYINHEKKFAFVEMRSVEEASNAMALDGIIFEGTAVKVRRPSDYNPSLAAALGPSQPNSNLNLAAVGLTPGSAGGLEGPDRIFVGGLPYYFTEPQVRELLEAFGPLRGFDLVKDRETGNSKGYAFCVYQDISVTDIACQALNGIKMGDKTLTVRRAIQGAQQSKPEQESVYMHVQQQISLQKMILQPGNLPTKVVCLTNCVEANQLKDDEYFQDILEDMRDEGGNHGALVNVVIPRPQPDGELSPGLGKVFLEYANVESASRARAALNGRRFDGNTVVGTYYPEDKFAEAQYGG